MNSHKRPGAYAPSTPTSTPERGAGNMRGRSYPALESGSVLWRPATDLAPADVEAYPIFVEQPVLVAVEEHLSSAPEQGLLGFLVGRLSECMQTGISYVHVDAAVRLPQMIAGDQSDSVVSQAWPAAQRLLRPVDGEIVGWYHSHPGGDLSLSPSDRSAHAGHFPEPWHVALVLSIGRAETTGEFVRVPAGSSAKAPAPLPLPFYELLDPSAIHDGWKRSRVSWSNHWSPDPAVWPATSVVLEPRIEFPIPGAPARSGRAVVAPPLARPAPSESAQVEMAEARPRRVVVPAPVARPAPSERAPDEVVEVKRRRVVFAPPVARPAPTEATPDEVVEVKRRRLVFAPPVVRPAPSEAAPDEVVEVKRHRLVFAPPVARLAASETAPDEVAEPQPRRGRRTSVLRVATLVAGGAALLAAAFAASRFVGPRLPSGAVLMASPSSARSNAVPVAPLPAVSPPAPEPTAVAADSLQRAIEGYQLRAALFATGKGGCEDLERGMVEIDAQWIQYNLARTRAAGGGVGGGGVSDSARLAADQALALAVERAEGDFERTGCPRP